MTPLIIPESLCGGSDRQKDFSKAGTASLSLTSITYLLVGFSYPGIDSRTWRCGWSQGVFSNICCVDLIYSFSIPEDDQVARGS